jgi:hypothetical protein
VSQAAAHTVPEKLIERQLDGHVAEIEEALAADVLTFVGPITYSVDDYIRDEVEEITPKRGRLAVILETTGGFIEVAQRIADTLRHHYGRVEFIVPNYAMSAGTVLVMSGDAIYMDYYSTLGPIDPQVQRSGTAGMVPALGYLEQYDRLVKRAQDGIITTAEVSYLIAHFDPAELYSYEQARELSVSRLKEWLVKYKFANWTKTETRGIDVTDQMRTARAEEIARALNNTQLWHSHSRGISMETVRRALKLRIEDFGASPELGGRIRMYHKLLQGYMTRRAHIGILHRKGSYLPFGGLAHENS